MPPDPASVEQSLLLEILSTLGLVQGQQNILLQDRELAAKGRQALREDIAAVNEKITELGSLKGRVGRLEEYRAADAKRIDALEADRDHRAGVVWTLRVMWIGVGSLILTGTLWLVGHISDLLQRIGK